MLLVVLAAPDPSSADPASPAGIWRFRTFRAVDGLAHDIVRDVLEDRDGNLWFATMGGITRYEPRRCRYQTFRFGDARDRVMALALGRQGEIWAATQGGGVGRYGEGRWRWFGKADGLPASLELTALLVDRQGRVWATPTGGGMTLFANGRWRVFGRAEGLTGGELGHCTETRAAAIICGTYRRRRLWRYDGRRWAAGQINASVKRDFYVHDLHEDRAGRLWLATKGAGALRGTPQPGGGYRWDAPPGGELLTSKRLGAVYQDRAGRLWFASAAGLSVYHQERWQHFGRADGLGSNHVFAITQAKDGALWFATLGGGAARYGPTRWQRDGAAQGLPSENLTGGLLLRRDGTLWTGTDLGLARFDGQRWQAQLTGDVGLDHVTDLAEDAGGALWVGTRNGIRRLSGGRWTHFRSAPSSQPATSQPATSPTGTSPTAPAAAAPKTILSGPPQRVINALAAAPNGDIWAATSGGVARFQGGRWRAYTPHDGLPAPRCTSVLVDRRGRVWAGTNNGVAKLEGERFRTFTLGPASRTNRVYRLAEDDQGRIWASGLEGVDIYEGERWHRLPASVWLPAGIYSRFLSRTRDGSLWFAVRGLGVRRLLRGASQGAPSAAGGAKNAQEMVYWAAFSSESGLPADTVRDVLLHPDGTLLFATVGGGIGRYRPDRQPPETFVGARPQSPVPTSMVDGQDLVLPFGGQDVLKDTPTAALLFSHRVDGGPWSDFQGQTRAQLRGLRPGAHLFEVRAMDRDFNIDPAPAVHRFTVVRPWWREPWLLGLLAATLLALLYAGLRIVRAVRRERAAIAEEQRLIEQRRRFVRLASHELRKPLTRMAHRAEMLAMPEMQAQGDLVTRYAEALMSDASHLAGLVQSLLDQAKVQEGLELALVPHELGPLLTRWTAEQGTHPGEGPTLDLPPRPLWARIDPLYLQLAIRNLLDNAQKYGGSTEGIGMTLEKRRDRVVIAVRDHGPGVPAEEQDAIFQPFHRGRTSPEHGGFGLGLAFARDIARAHGGDLVLKSPSPADGDGSTAGALFELGLPLQTAPSDDSGKVPPKGREDDA